METLLSKELNMKKPILFIIEGVLYYLTRLQVNFLFSTIKDISLALLATCEILLDSLTSL